MNLRKHLAGLMVFSIILGSAIFINHFLTFPNATIISAPLRLTFSELKEKPRPFNYVVKQVSLDLFNKKSYTQLWLERQPGQAAPEKLWVTTFFFSPAYPRGLWISKAEISQPFAESDQTDLVATAWCSLALLSETPKPGYFARVYISTEETDDSYPPDAPFDRDIETAVPVVVSWQDVDKLY
jgi:hypothetical protein